MRKHRKTRFSSSRRNRRETQSSLIGPYAKMIIIPFAVLGIGAYATQHYMGIETHDENYCYARSDQHKSAIFIDNSLARQSASQMRDYQTGFEQAFETAPPNAKILIYTTASHVSGSLPKPLFTICKSPATPAEQAEIAAPEETAALLKKRTNKVKAIYHREVQNILRDIQDPDKRAIDSPILEQLRGISQAVEFQGANRSLTAITDGLQNSAAVGSFCQFKGHMMPFQIFKQRPDYETRIKPRSFAGTKIKFLLVEFGRFPSHLMPHCSNNELLVWWADYFKGNGADTIEITPLRYWGIK